MSGRMSASTRASRVPEDSDFVGPRNQHCGQALRGTLAQADCETLTHIRKCKTFNGSSQESPVNHTSVFTVPFPQVFPLGSILFYKQETCLKNVLDPQSQIPVIPVNMLILSINAQ